MKRTFKHKDGTRVTVDIPEGSTPADVAALIEAEKSRIEGQMKEATLPPVLPTGGAMGSAAQGAAFGFYPEIYAALTAIQNVDPSLYGPVRDRIEQKLAESGNPLSEMAGGVLSSMLPGGAVARMAKGMGYLPKLAAIALGGAGEGAIAGAGHADPGERGAGALTGGVVGGLAGAGLSGAGSIVGRGGKWMMDLLRLNSVDEIAGKIIHSATKGAPMEAVGDAGTVGDATRGLQNIAGVVAQTPGAEAGKMAKYYAARQMRSNDRMVEALMEGFEAGGGKKVLGVDDIEEVINQRSQQVGHMYDVAYYDWVDQGVTLERLFNDPGVNRIIPNALNSLKRQEFLGGTVHMPHNSKTAESILDVFDDPSAQFSVPFLHQINKGIQDGIEMASRAGEREKVRELTGMNKLLSGIIEDASPAFREAQQFAEYTFRIGEARDAGMGALSDKVKLSDLHKTFADFGIGETSGELKDAFRAGFLESVIQAGTTKPQFEGSLVKAFDVPLYQSKTQFVMESPPHFRALQKVAADERKYAETYKRTRPRIPGGDPLGVGATTSSVPADIFRAGVWQSPWAYGALGQKGMRAFGERRGAELSERLAPLMLDRTIGMQYIPPTFNKYLNPYIGAGAVGFAAPALGR